MIIFPRVCTYLCMYLGLGLKFGPQRIKDLAILCPYSVVLSPIFLTLTSIRNRCNASASTTKVISDANNGVKWFLIFFFCILIWYTCISLFFKLEWLQHFLSCSCRLQKIWRNHPFIFCYLSKKLLWPFQGSWTIKEEVWKQANFHALDFFFWY